MKKYLLVLSIPVIYALSVLCSHDVSAKFINSVKSLSAPGDQCGDHSNEYDATLFNVDFNYGSDCKYDGSTICSKTTEFRCVESGLHCSRKADVDKISVTPGDCGRKWTYLGGKNTSKYDYFCVAIKTDKDTQDVMGLIKRPALFAGQSVVYGGGSSKSTGYVSTDTTAGSLEIRNCSYISGCTATFKHYVKRVFDHTSKTTNYEVALSSNDTSKVANVNSPSGNAGTDSGVEVSSRSVTLYPGMVVCETLDFGISSENSTTKRTKVCAAATGSLAKNIGLDILVKNKSVIGQSEYRHEVFAKPGDALSYKANYNPEAQVAYNSNVSPQKINVGNASCTNNGGLTLVNLFNSCGSGGDWNNAFSVRIDGVHTIGPKVHNNYGLGNTASREEIHDEYNKVDANDVGVNSNGRDGVIGHALMNSIAGRAGDKRTPKKVTASMEGDVNVVTVDVNLEDVKAYARVPYNFITESEVLTESTEEKPVYFYAGEEQKIDYRVRLNKKTNQVTTDRGSEEEAYTTRADDVIRELVVYNRSNPNVEPDKGGVWENHGRSADSCGYFGLSEGNNCSRSGRNETTTLEPKNNAWQDESLKFNVQDLPAGSQVCIAVATFPANSGLDTNYNDFEYSRSWHISGSKCFTIAKRPSIQIWGGSVYSRGDLVTSTAVKNNLAGYHVYSAKDKRGTFAFGSWGELGVVTNGKVNGFGSGASMGYASNNNGILSPDPFAVNTASSAPKPGGSDKKDFCQHIPLTIPNTLCNNTSGITFLLNSTVSITKATSDKESIVNLLASGSDTTNHNHYNRKIELSKNGENGAVAVGATIGSGITRVISSDDDITITTDLEYFTTSDQFTNYSQIPKLIIYSKKNIYINCEVHKIDALLIANDTVVTCDNLGDVSNLNTLDKLKAKIEETVNNPENSNQLMINGAIIAKRLIANRTYGAATGANSIVPAEIINFDPTLYQFGGSIDDTEDETIDDRLDITNIREVAPRL